jgi:hypothetical protein
MDGHPGWLAFTIVGGIAVGGFWLFLFVHAMSTCDTDYKFPIPLPWDGRPAKTKTPQTVINPKVPWLWTLLAWAAGGAAFEGAWLLVHHKHWLGL